MLVYVNLEKSTIEDAEAQIDSIKLSKIFKYCMHKSDDLTLTLKIGNSITYHSLGVLGYLIQNTSNLKELIEKFSHYQKLISGFMKFHLEKDNKYYKLIIYINENPTIQVPSFHAEVHLAAILSILSQIIGKEILPDKVFYNR